MADDTRQPESPSDGEVPQEEVRRPRRPKPKHDFPKTQAGKMWEAFGNPDEPINMVPGGQYNSAGGKPAEVTWKDAFKFKKGDATKFYKIPCSRDALLVGVGAGGAFGGVKFILSGVRSLRTSANWAVGGFAIASLGMYQWCESRRRKEAQGMALAVIGMKKLQEKERRQKEAQAAKDAAEKEAARLAEEERQRNTRWYKFW